VGPVIGRLCWTPVGRLVRDRNLNRTCVEARALAAASGRLLADMLARLAGDATEILAELHAAPQPTPSVDQPVGNDDQAGAS
jgi:hypothetical protein